MATQIKTNESKVINGINVLEFEKTVQAVKTEPELAKFQFRASNSWDRGSYNRTTIKGFYGAGEEQGADDRTFVLAASDRSWLNWQDRLRFP